MPRITDLVVSDVRFPTSELLDGSDAMNPDPDYSAAVVEIRTDDPGLRGFGMTFTIGRGNELCCAAIDAFRSHVVGRRTEDLEADLGSIATALTGDSQLRWLGPEKGVVHLATAALVNAQWDLLARHAGLPLWKYLADLSPEQIVSAVDFRHMTDALTPAEALELVATKAPLRDEREAQLLAEGYPAYITSAGWLGYDDDKVRRQCEAARAAGWTALKMKVGRDPADDLRRGVLIRELVGPECRLMLDANQVWDVSDAIAQTKALAEIDPYWIEEPTSPDDVLGHARVRDGVRPIRVATGEHCHNRVMFKQFFQANAIDVCQLDGCRLGGVNEVIAVLLLAAHFGIPVCPHAGGVGLCEHVQHFSMFDYVAVSGSLDGRMIEYADHLHEHMVQRLVVEGGRYRAPLGAGFGIELEPQSVAKYRYPDGTYWASR
ncbi:MAG TPA: enolase C-terminal domain-like protein [Acidimicrobiales bacterium]|nr:enolase C-terminal domain-like protein [Acidimicrobiales bacterium]